MPEPPDAGTRVVRTVPFVRWIGIGVIGVLLLFAGAAYLPDEFRRPGLTAIVLGGAAGWGLGRWGMAQGVRPTAPAILAAFLLLAIGQVAMTLRIHGKGVEQMRAQAQWQETAGDPVTEKLREFLAVEPEGESTEDRAKRLDLQASLEKGEAKRRERLEYFSFGGYLAHRIPPSWGSWSAPWPALFWGTEILLGSCVGAWLMLIALRSGSEQSPPPAEPPPATSGA